MMYMPEDIKLVYTSAPVLKRSIRLMYPNMTKEQWKATFNDQKQYITNKSTEQILDEKWAKYKKENEVVMTKQPRDGKKIESY